MRIAVEARYLLAKEKTGVENYTYFLLAALAQLEGEHELHLYVHRPVRAQEKASLEPFYSSPRCHFHIVPPLRLWLKLWMPLAARLHGCDVGLFPGSILPRYLPFPAVGIVYDLCWADFPECYPPRDIHIFRDIYPRSLAAAKMVFAISEFTKNDITRIYGTPAEKIRVVPCGLDPAFSPVPQAAEKVRARWDLEPGYILAVGTLHPRKNIATLLRAYALAKPPNLLVLIGPQGETAGELAELAGELQITERVKWLGYVGREELPEVYSAAGLFAMPSLYEGFGFPALEAMACGTPVVCSNASALPEIAAGAALMFDPGDAQALADAIWRVQTEAGLAEGLRNKGLQRARDFDWKRSAEVALSYLREAAAPPRPRQRD